MVAEEGKISGVGTGTGTGVFLRSVSPAKSVEGEKSAVLSFFSLPLSLPSTYPADRRERASAAFAIILRVTFLTGKHA